jgi:hypothetical protein
MLIVGGAAALIAIAAYLAWFYVGKLRTHLRRRRKPARERGEAHERRIDVHEPTH